MRGELSTDLAIVLQHRRYEERHQIITALTAKHGKISALARNSVQSRRFGGTLELFAASEWKFSKTADSSFVHLQEAESKTEFKRIRSDYDRLCIAGFISEIVTRGTIPGEMSDELFRLHSNALVLLENQEDFNSISFLSAYLAKILQWSGSLPQFRNCVDCKSDIHALDSDQPVSGQIDPAGVLCSNCLDGTLSDNFVFTAAHAKALRAVLISPIRKSLELPLTDPQFVHYLVSTMIYHVPGFDRSPLKSVRLLNL